MASTSGALTMFGIPPATLGIGTDQAMVLAGLLPLVAILYAAVRSGFREATVPDPLVLTGLAAGFLLNAVLPAGDGFLAPLPGGLGAGASVAGMVVGAAAMLPFHLLKAVRGDDLKLMAVVGAFLGPADVVPAIFSTLLAGGLIALAAAFHLGTLRRLLANLAIQARNFPRLATPGAAAHGAPQPLAGMPYALAVAAGTLGTILWSLGLPGRLF